MFNMVSQHSTLSVFNATEKETSELFEMVDVSICSRIAVEFLFIEALRRTSVIASPF